MQELLEVSTQPDEIGNINLQDQKTEIDDIGTIAKRISSVNLPTRYSKYSVPFNVSPRLIPALLPSDGFINLTSYKMTDFVFVTAASSNHFDESKDAVASVQTIMPKKKIIYFDLGLKEDQIKKVLYR